MSSPWTLVLSNVRVHCIYIFDISYHVPQFEQSKSEVWKGKNLCDRRVKKTRTGWSSLDRQKKWNLGPDLVAVDPCLTWWSKRKWIWTSIYLLEEIILSTVCYRSWITFTSIVFVRFWYSRIIWHRFSRIQCQWRIIGYFGQFISMIFFVRNWRFSFCYFPSHGPPQ